MKKGLQLAPAQVASMSAAEKIQGMKDAEQMMRDTLKYQVELQKTQMTDTSREKAAGTTAASRIDAAAIAATSRKYVADAYKDTRDKKGAAISYAAWGLAVHQRLPNDYLDMSEKGERPDQVLTL